MACSVSSNVWTSVSYIECCICVMLLQYIACILLVEGFVYKGLGARWVASFGGRGARLWRLSLKHFVLEVTFGHP